MGDGISAQAAVIIAASCAAVLLITVGVFCFFLCRQYRKKRTDGVAARGGVGGADDEESAAINPDPARHLQHPQMVQVSGSFSSATSGDSIGPETSRAMHPLQPPSSARSTNLRPTTGADAPASTAGSQRLDFLNHDPFDEPDFPEAAGAGCPRPFDGVVPHPAGPEAPRRSTDNARGSATTTPTNTSTQTPSEPLFQRRSSPTSTSSPSAPFAPRRSLDNLYNPFELSRDRSLNPAQPQPRPPPRAASVHAMSLPRAPPRPPTPPPRVDSSYSNSDVPPLPEIRVSGADSDEPPADDDDDDDEDGDDGIKWIAPKITSLPVSRDPDPGDMLWRVAMHYRSSLYSDFGTDDDDGRGDGVGSRSVSPLADGLEDEEEDEEEREDVWYSRPTVGGMAGRGRGADVADGDGRWLTACGDSDAGSKPMIPVAVAEPGWMRREESPASTLPEISDIIGRVDKNGKEKLSLTEELESLWSLKCDPSRWSGEA
ncbi:hypothetical protein HK101_003817 [Irineochytrium annulatum]|nr:hypothetical protein HK101_003817 [Irineochytrium annulatum]